MNNGANEHRERQTQEGGSQDTENKTRQSKMENKTDP